MGALEKEMLIIARNIAVERGQKLTILAELPKVMRKDLKDFCERNGMEFLIIDFDHVSDNLIHGKHDPHWNVKAHQLIADQILSQVDWKLLKDRESKHPKTTSRGLYFVSSLSTLIVSSH